MLGTRFILAFLATCTSTTALATNLSLQLPSGPDSIAARSFRTTLLWPDPVIHYCFKDSDSEKQLNKILIEAWKLWVVAGANVNMKPLDRTNPICPSDKGLFLSIRAVKGGQDQCSLALDDDGSEIHELELDPKPAGQSKERVISNMAHELGHAWGLIHEHQRPDIWLETSKTHLIFDCTKVFDYEEMVKKAKELNIDVDILCTVGQTSRRLGFFAGQVLPRKNDQTTTVDGTEMDWNSIMLYPGYYGSRATAEDTYMTRSDGVAINRNLFPSPGDITRLNDMYEVGDLSAFLLDNTSNRLNRSYRTYVKEKLKDSCGVQ